MRVLKRLRRLIAAAAILGVTWSPTAAQNKDLSETGSVLLMTSIEGPIGPATVKHVNRVIDLAQDRNAAAVILSLNTPGGLAVSMREIISAILGSPVPVVGYVSPAGAHAASAGTYILYATHIAAMAPATNLGAATPVTFGGFPERFPNQEREGRKSGKSEGDDSPDDGTGLMAPEDAMTAKMTNDAVALIRGLAEMHGRNADWAEKAVREAASLSSRSALEINVIDILASSTDELLVAIDGRVIEIHGSKHTLSVAGLPIETVEMDLVTRILSVLSNPNVALILMMIGVYGLIFEFWNPGAIVPGVVGAISLTLGLYALNMLPFTYAGLALIGLGVAFMVVEAMTPTIGVLGIGGLIAFVFGAFMLIDTDAPGFQVSWWLIGTLATASGAILVLLLGYLVRAYRHAPVSGRAQMIGAMANVIEWHGGEGFVWTEGERWHATGAKDLSAGQMVRVRDVEGLTLIVNATSDLQAERER
ncbi:MAG: nodulation protein NfeD [Pseudomonadota bacterium]